MRPLLLAAVLAALAGPAVAQSGPGDDAPVLLQIVLDPADPMPHHLWLAEVFADLAAQARREARDGKAAERKAARAREEELRGALAATKAVIETRQAWARADFSIGMALRLQSRLSRLLESRGRAGESQVYSLRPGADEAELRALRDQFLAELLAAARRVPQLEGQEVIAGAAGWGHDALIVRGDAKPEPLLTIQEVFEVLKALDRSRRR